MKYIFFGIFLWITQLSIGQKTPLNEFVYPDFVEIDTLIKSKYPYIRFQKNNFQFYSSKSENWTYFGEKMNEITTKHKNQMNFYHIGGSHLQADIYTHDIRTFLQTKWDSLPGARGMVFPFDLARTNNPSNYTFSSPNYWQVFKSVGNKQENIQFGVMGATIVCPDSIINLSFRHDKTEVKPPYTILRVLHNKGDFPFDLQFGDFEILVEKVLCDTLNGFTEIHFVDPIQELDLQFSRNTVEKIPLEIYGFQFLNDLPGFTYNAIGINGAGLYTYLANKNFEEQLKILPPDFFAFSVGTNDANVPFSSFNPSLYKHNLEQMIQIVLRANPKCAILLTVPNDAYYYKKYPNQNVARLRAVIIELAAQYELAVWDFYGVMGELGSSQIWHHDGLMQADKVHFTANGYHLKGKLFIDAFLKYLNQINKEI